MIVIDFGILDHWDMWSSRNVNANSLGTAIILDHWDMWSSRNGIGLQPKSSRILDHWDMWSSRNGADVAEPVDGF